MASDADLDMHARRKKTGKDHHEAAVYLDELTPLQKHVAFFDRNKDGLIYPSETYQGPPSVTYQSISGSSVGADRHFFMISSACLCSIHICFPQVCAADAGFRAIGSGVVLSLVGAVFINGFLGPKTRPAGTFPSLYFPIYVRNIKRGKHGSDSGVYDSEGRFVPTKFEEMFHKHAKTNPDALTSKELGEMLDSNRVHKDYRGWLASWTEWKVLYFLCKDNDGLLHKDVVKDVYDGSLFLKMEEKVHTKKS